MFHKSYDYSIRKKLVYFFSFSAILALIISTSTTLVYSYLYEKESMIKDNIKLAEVSGKNIAASLLFVDEKSCQSILKPIIHHDKNIRYIKVYDQKGKFFTSIGQDVGNKDNIAQKIKLMKKNVLFSVDWNHMKIITSISYEDEVIGYLEVYVGTGSIKKRMISQAISSLIIMFITIFIVLLLAIKLEKVFLKPIFELLNAMKEIRKDKKFNVNLVSSTKDEFGELFNEFNMMTNEIYKRDQILRAHNLDLELLVNTTNEKLKTTQDDLDKISILATTDSLTGLYNRRCIMDKFDDMLSIAREHGKYIGVIMLDIDHFKMVNDTLGHQAGDEVLKEVSKILKENARDVDEVGRIGGEEFLVLCENSSMEVVKEVAERLRTKVEDKVIYYENDKTTQVKISLGIYSCVADINISKEELIKIADDALYDAKETGRNKVVTGTIK